MLRNTVAGTLSYFYPFGNTPAVCLTQRLPPEQDANILLLGCGDVRHVLFTLYAQLGNRKLDFTCCDIEPAILARNVLLLTLILDDTGEKNTTLLWNIYYHVLIDSASLALLDAHATQLLQYAESLSTWNNGPYGHIIRFCNATSLSQVRSIWQEYTLPSKDDERRSKTKVLIDALEKARNVKDINWKGRSILTGMRSASPTSVMAIRDLPKLVEAYWEKGSLYTGKDLSAASNPNPAILFSGVRVPTLHYGSDPLLGFHLATAYMPLSQSKLSPDAKSDAHKGVVEAAQLEFKAWATSFYKAAQDGRIVIRYFAGDALAFAHTLHAVGAHGQPTTANWFVNSWTFTPLTLDDEAYRHTTKPAPTIFDVIDTSNLGDHLGSLNVLIATAPLLRAETSSTIFTEILVQREASVRSTLDIILCGHFDSVCLLLGLAVVETWTNASSAAENDHVMMKAISSQPMVNAESNGTQMLTRMSWKLTSAIESSALHMRAEDLAKLLHSLYKDMFGHEDITRLMSSVKLSDLGRASNPYYNRASFAALLHFLRSHIETEWPEVFQYLLTAIESEDALSVSRNYLQELTTYLHVMNLHTVDVLTKNPRDVFKRTLEGRLADRPSLPPVMAVTVRVPRSNLTFLTQMKPEEVGILLLNCSLQSAKHSPQQWLNQFGVVQAAFGQLIFRQFRDPGACCVMVNEDESGWMGKSPLIVSFLVPTWMLLQDEDSTLVSVGFQSTLHTIKSFTKYLDTNLQFFSTKLGSRQLHITETMPHQQSHAKIAPQVRRADVKKPDSPHIAQSVLSGVADPSGKSIQSLARRIDLQHEAKETLADRSTEVETGQMSAMVIDIAIGDDIGCSESFPRPVAASRSKLRVARKSSYVEVIAPFLSPLQVELMEPFVFPGSLSISASSSKLQKIQKIPVNWNMHAVNLNVSPIIDVSQPQRLEWLTVHASLMFSQRERKERDAPPLDRSQRDYRVDFKDGLFSMLMQYSGVQGVRARIFGLHMEPKGIDTLFFVSCMRFNLSDRVVILDAAVIPLEYSLMQDPLFRNVLHKMQTVCPPMAIKVVGPELRIWKSILPALAERCRTWSHNQKTCEYIKHGKIPTPNGLEGASTPLCSCGRGKNLPNGYMKQVDIPGLDKVLQKYATRIAISPVYHVSYVEDAVDMSTIANNLFSPSTAELTGQNDRCATCGKKEGPSTTLSKCARCKSVKYCSKACQKSDWKKHKPVCS